MSRSTAKRGAQMFRRYTVVEDAGKAIHPLQVEGQYQGGAVQGVGWALERGLCLWR